MPIAHPPINLAIINCTRLSGRVLNIAEIRNKIAEAKSIHLRPHLSERKPAMPDPNRQPNDTLLTARPNSNGVKEKYFVKNGIAPATTATSKPNNKPAPAATQVIIYTYILFSGLTGFCIVFISTLILKMQALSL